MMPDSPLEQLNSVTKPLLDYLTVLTRNFQNFFQQMMAEREAAAKVHPRVLEVLLSRGWCHSYEFPDRALILLNKLADAGDLEHIDLLMADFTRHQFDRIQHAACKTYPARAAILTDAFEAHQSKKFTLSVPTLLAQVDGIGCEVLGIGRYFYYKDRRKDGLANVLAQLKLPGEGTPYPVSPIHKQMLAAFEVDWPLTLDSNKRPVGSPLLNRNGVLHGLDTDYATEMNSLRCVLLLGFLLEVRKWLREEFPKEVAETAAILEGIPSGDVDG